MRVAVETNALFVTQAGVARYVRGLLGGLSRISHPDIDLFEFAWKVENFGYQQPLRAIRTAYRELIWARFLSPRLLLKQGADLLHSTTGYMARHPRSIPNVVTLHDLAFIRHPERFRRWQKWSGQQNLLPIRSADRVICISQFTADEAMELLALPASKITVVYNGCDFQPTEGAVPESAPDFAVPDEFFLFVGSLEPGKNLALARAAYLAAEAEGRRLPPLLIVGARWPGVKHEGEPVSEWRYLGRQPDSALVYLYKRALGLVFPSKYEGFGLPVAEAMAVGCPVICSPVASLPEVCGDAALLTEMNPAAYLAAMRRLISDPGLRDELIGKGKARAGRFSWSRCAGETAQVYRDVLS